MKSQKFILHSRTIWSSILTLLIAVCPMLLEGVEGGFTEASLGQIIGVIVSTLMTILSRYHTDGEIYTPRGLPGRDYRPAYQDKER